MFFWCPSVCRLKLWHRTTARVGIDLVTVVFLAGTVHLKYNQIDAAAAPFSQSTWTSQDGWNWMKQIAKDFGGFLYLYSMPLRNMIKGNLTILAVVSACLVPYLRWPEFDRICLTISWLCLKSSTSNQTFYTHELLQPLVDVIFSLHWRCTPLAPRSDKSLLLQIVTEHSRSWKPL